MNTKEVEMIDVNKKKEENIEDNNKKEINSLEESKIILLEDLKKNIQLLEKSVITKETRFMLRVLRTLNIIRRKITLDILKQFINQTFISELEQNQKQILLSYLEKVPLDKNELINMNSQETSPIDISKQKSKVTLPEVELYIYLLVTIFLIDKKMYNEAKNCADQMIEKLSQLNRRTLNPISAKIYFYYSRIYELINQLDKIREILFAHYRTACLRHNEEAQSMLLNLLLRNLLKYNLYDQADKLVSKTTFHEDTASTNQHVRYLYYQGKIKSIQLEYTEAYRCLLGALRRAPQNSAKGFRLAVTKLACIVQLLMGEIPERSLFKQPGLQKALDPYFQITKAVGIGDVVIFQNAVQKFKDIFCKDKTYTLIQRLHHNVIKTGLRKINLSYSRIPFSDICSKLHLDNIEDAEFIVAKAIRDGVIHAVINHEGGYVQSKEKIDIYSTQEPQAAFHRRITFCLNIHNEAIKAMRFPPDAHKLSLETVKERREREQEIAKNLVDDDEEDF
jgi:26S proteasome regulatory subunit N3